MASGGALRLLACDAYPEVSSCFDIRPNTYIYSHWLTFQPCTRYQVRQRGLVAYRIFPSAVMHPDRFCHLKGSVKQSSVAFWYFGLWHFVILAFCHFDILAFWHFGIWTFGHFYILVCWHFGILTFGYFGICTCCGIYHVRDTYYVRGTYHVCGPYHVRGTYVRGTNHVRGPYHVRGT